MSGFTSDGAALRYNRERDKSGKHLQCFKQEALAGDPVRGSHREKSLSEIFDLILNVVVYSSVVDRYVALDQTLLHLQWRCCRSCRLITM